MPTPDLVTLRPQGLYCAAGDFYIDPWRPVPRAVLTHGHADHARAGHAAVLCAARGLPVLRTRRGEQQALQGLAWGERLRLGEVTVSLHPASHVLGAAQVRIEGPGGVWVVSGDYRVAGDASCDAFEPVRCDVFITESTFGMPIYRWAPQAQVMQEIAQWWRAAAQQGEACVLYTYALGKAQRVLLGLQASGALAPGAGLGPVFAHSAVVRLNEAYAQAGSALPACPALPEQWPPGSLVLAPPALQGSRRGGRWRCIQREPCSAGGASTRLPGGTCSGSAGQAGGAMRAWA
ncbi:MAG: DNA ligase-associated DEXH box helicase [Limnohabitans sp.]